MEVTTLFSKRFKNSEGKTATVHIIRSGATYTAEWKEGNQTEAWHQGENLDNMFKSFKLRLNEKTAENWLPILSEKGPGV